MAELEKTTPHRALGCDAAGADSGGKSATRVHHLNLAELAYDRLEELIVDCTLKPGLALSLQDLQTMVELGRTPIHQAVNRLAADTLITIRPRHGLQVTPIDLSRDQTLLPLRRDMERFVVRLATERGGASHRAELRHIIRVLHARGAVMDIAEFNRLDRRINQLLSAASGEPFLENTLRPLHTIFRRIGWIYHSWVAPEAGLSQTIAGHLAVIEAVAGRNVAEATAASDRLIDFMTTTFDAIERRIDPVLLDCTLTMSIAS